MVAKNHGTTQYKNIFKRSLCISCICVMYQQFTMIPPAAMAIVLSELTENRALLDRSNAISLLLIYLIEANRILEIMTWSVVCTRVSMSIPRIYDLSVVVHTIIFL